MNDSTATPANAGFADARDTWNARFSQPGLHYGAEPNSFLVREASRLAPGSRILSVADGEGRNGIWLAEQGHQVSAFDISPVAVDKARRWASERGVEVDFHVAAVDEWDWAPERFDAVVAIFVQFADPSMRQRLFSGMWRTLKPGGLLLVEGYAVEQLAYGTGGPGRRDHLYTPELLRELLPQAQWLLLQQREAVLNEGRGHVGRSALIDAVARKPVA
ncbi:MAG: class I SAM-dependent methyltransferase [Thiomonas sp.]